jgi:CRP-like cAMP-binding protein
MEQSVPMASSVVLKGDLGFLPLAEVLQLLGGNSATGTLRIFSPHVPDNGHIKFSEGQAVDAGCPGKNGLDAVYALFGWIEGTFEFTDGEFKGKRTVQSSLMEIVMDGVRMLDEGEIAKVGPEGAQAPKKPADDREKSAGIPVIKRQIANYNYVVDENEFPDGETIVLEGRHGGWVCVVVDGYADVIRETPKGPLRISRIGPGAVVGNISSLLGQKSIRTATVRAVGEVVLGVLDLQRIHTEFSCISYELRRLAMSLDKRLVEVTNRVVEAHLGTINLNDFTQGKTKIFDQGADEDRVLRITQGTAAVIRKSKTGDAPLLNLSKGDFLGRVPFMNIDHEPHSAYVLGSADFQTETLDIEGIKKEYDQAPSVVRSIMEYVATCVSVTTIIACDPRRNPLLAGK